MARMFAPLSTSFLGFDRLFSDLERMLDMPATTNSGYPPLNMYREVDGGYTIELAVAGFKKDHISIELNEKTGLLTIIGDNDEKGRILSDPSASTEVVAPASNRMVLKAGIANRQFVRQFTLADTVEVGDVTLEDGLLTIRLNTKQPQLPETKLIPIK